MSRAGGIKQVTLALNGVPQYLGTIAATITGVDNSNTGVPFVIGQGPGFGTGLVLEADADVFYSFAARAASTPPATTASKKLSTGDVYVVAKEDLPYLICRTATGTAYVKVFKVS